MRKEMQKMLLMTKRGRGKGKNGERRETQEKVVWLISKFCKKNTTSDHAVFVTFQTLLHVHTVHCKYMYYRMMERHCHGIFVSLQMNLLKRVHQLVVAVKEVSPLF